MSRPAEPIGPTFDELLDAVPTPNRAVTAERYGREGVTLTVPLKRRWYMNAPWSWLLPLRTRKKLQLDKLGREVWRMTDGETTTERIIERFAESHHLSFHESRMAVSQFLQKLTHNGAVALVGREAPAEPQ